MIIANQTFENTDVTLDGVTYEKCTFQGCRLMYHGSSGPDLRECTFTDCAWGVFGAAQNTLNFLMGLYRLAPVGTGIVEAIIQQIRTGQLPPGAHVQTNLPNQAYKPKDVVN